MKCDHIRTRKQGDTPFFPNILNNGNVEVCLKEDVDAAIAELREEILNLKAKNIKLQSFYDLHGNVDNYIDKLKAENAELKAKLENVQAENAQLKKETEFMHSNCKWDAGDGCARLLGEKLAIIDENVKLKQKLENVQASMYADVVDANMENRRLKRALWLARAKRAIEKIACFKLWNSSISTMNPEDGARQEFDKWKKSLGKFLKKAEEYK